MPTLLQINVASNSGSTGRIAEQIGILAKSRGWESYVAHGARYLNESQLHSIQVSSSVVEKLHWVKSVLLDQHGLGSTRSTRAFLKEIDKIHPDIVHLHNIHGYFINYKILFKYLISKQIPIVWTLHDCWAFTGHCMYFDSANCNRWKSECFSCPLKNDYPSSVFLDRSSRNFKLKKELFTSLSNIVFVPVSYWLENLVKSSFLGGFETHVIHNGIDLNVFRLNPIRPNDGIFRILAIGNSLVGRKGLSDLTKIKERLKFRCQIILLGLSSNDIRRLPTGIIGVPRINSQEELSRYYSNADVFVNPTYEDNFPTTNIEALACGTPVITYRTGGSPEAIDEKTGIVVEKGHIDELVAAIEKIYLNGKQTYSQACRERAERLFNKDDRFADYIKLYDERLNK